MPELRGLYAVTPEQHDTDTLLRQVCEVLRGGGRLIQYRDKNSDPAKKLARARALKDLCVEFQARLLINDDVALAERIGADGVHLGKDDGDPRAARARLGQTAIIGVSCYGDLARAQAAERAGASYVAFGAVFSSPTKSSATPVGLEVLTRARSVLALPICAIGGVDLANASAVIAAGADLLAVISELFSAPDIAARSAAFQSLFKDQSV